MKKSTLFYTGAGIAFLVSLTWTALILFGYYKLAIFDSSLFPFPQSLQGFAILFLAIFLCVKGNKALNIEHGRNANAVIPLTKGYKMVNTIGISLCVAVVILAALKYYLKN